MRKPTIQAKPKLNRPVIPAGATVISTTTVSKEQKQQAEENENNNNKESTIKSAAAPSLGPLRRSVPFFTSADDVNGFKAMQSSKVN